VSGLFRRLAARALGVAPTVRPVVGHPAEAGVSAAVNGAPLAPGTELAGTTPSPGARATDASPPAVPEVAATRTDAGRLPQVPIESSAPTQDEPRATPRSAAEARIAPPEAAREPARLIVAPAHAETEEPRPATADRARPSHDAPRDAPPLLPSQPLARFLPPQAITGSTPPPAMAARPPVEETTEVHVTIGRIEVTAVHEAPPPRREPARPRKAKSLAEHLAQRQGSRA
jgi:hypothetical protein